MEPEQSVVSVLDNGAGSGKQGPSKEVYTVASSWRGADAVDRWWHVHHVRLN